MFAVSPLARLNALSVQVRAIWKFVGTHYLDQFDWFYLGGDDLFVLPHNLRTYLASLARKDAADPRERAYFVGHRKRNRARLRSQMYGVGSDGFGTTGWFNTGGAGYVMSQVRFSILEVFPFSRIHNLKNKLKSFILSQGALRTFLAVMDDRRKCPEKVTSEEDVMISKCLQRAGVRLTDTRDAMGRERFHFWTPEMRFYWDTSVPTWYGDTQREWGLKNGTLCCAPDSVSFHYINQPSLVRHLHALLHHCEDGAQDENEGSRPSPVPALRRWLMW